MSILHTLNGSTFENKALFSRLLHCASAGDSVLLLENGVYVMANTADIQSLLDAGLNVYCLQADCQARGITSQLATSIDDHGFVELACSHHKVVSWFV